MTRMLDINKHPCNAASILSWMLYHWDDVSNQPLLVITTAGDGKHLVNRVRVRLSDARNYLRKRKHPLKSFTLTAVVTPWGVEEDITYEAVTFERVHGAKHRFNELIQDSKFGG